MFIQEIIGNVGDKIILLIGNIEILHYFWWGKGMCYPMNNHINNRNETKNWKYINVKVGIKMVMVMTIMNCKWH